MMLISGSVQVGGLWISPEALLQVFEGQLIDNDINTKVVVSKVGKVVNDQAMVVISEKSPHLIVEVNPGL